MPTPRATRSEQLSFRAEPALVKRIDDLRAAMKKRLRGVDLSRSDLLKTLIEQSLPAMEVEYFDPNLGERPDWASPEERKALVVETIRSMLEIAEMEGFDIEVPGYKRK